MPMRDQKKEQQIIDSLTVEGLTLKQLAAMHGYSNRHNLRQVMNRMEHEGKVKVFRAVQHDDEHLYRPIWALSPEEVIINAWLYKMPPTRKAL